MAIGVIGLISCKKQYSCECSSKISAGGITVSDAKTSESISRKMSNKTATASCDNTKRILESQIKSAAQGYDTNVSCSLK